MISNHQNRSFQGELDSDSYNPWIKNADSSYKCETLSIPMKIFNEDMMVIGRGHSVIDEWKLIAEVSRQAQVNDSDWTFRLNLVNVFAE